jgi:acyl-CoA oxidase
LCSLIADARAHLLQDDIFKPNLYLSLLEFRELTLQRLKKFVAAKFPDGRGFEVRDYLNSEFAHNSLSGCSVFSTR